jgi:hypothetical protein
MTTRTFVGPEYDDQRVNQFGDEPPLCPTRTLQSLVWSNCLFRPRPYEVSLVGLSNIRVSGVSVLEVRIVFGRSSTLVSNQAMCIQVAA